MVANYHTHTMRCNHAQGSDEAYVQHAIQGNLKLLGFSDHTPYPFNNGYHSRIRMDTEELSEYCKSLSELRLKYHDQIQIRIGLEAEFYPAHFSELMSLVRESDIEYMILGQHWNHNEYDCVYNGRPTEDEGQLIQYCSQSLKALETGLFSYMAHPDLINYIGNPAVYEKHIGNFCRQVAAMKIPLEYNLGGLRAQCHYPNAMFWNIAAEAGCQAVIGVDAHHPKQLTDAPCVEQAEDFIKELGIVLLEKVDLRPVR